MTTELETIIKSKFFDELTFEELSALSEYCSNEAEFNVLKEMFTSSDLYQQENTQVDSAVKEKLDLLFNATYSEKNKQVTPILQFIRYKRPIFYLAAASVIFLVSFLFLRFNSNEPNKLAETPKQKKDITPKSNDYSFHFSEMIDLTLGRKSGSVYFPLPAICFAFSKHLLSVSNS